MTKVIVSLSGGIDSTTAAALAIRRHGRENVMGIGFDYGQAHIQELDQARQVANYLGIQYSVMPLHPIIFLGSESTLLEGNTPAQIGRSYDEIAEDMGSQATVVPNRNMMFISIATAVAMSRGYDEVWVGVHAGDAHNFHYPDCRPAFIGAMSAAVDLSSEGKVTLYAPFNFHSKTDIVEMGAEMRAPLHLTRSCYLSQGMQCGECATCIERIEAFHGAGYFDPTLYSVCVDFPDNVLLRHYPIDGDY